MYMMPSHVIAVTALRIATENYRRVWEGAVRPCILPQSLLRSAGLHWYRPYCDYQCLPPRPRRTPRATMQACFAEQQPLSRLILQSHLVTCFMQASGGIVSSPTAKRQKTGKTEAANGHTPCSGTAFCHADYMWTDC